MGYDICKNLLFVHALTGSDTTSRIFGVGKAGTLKAVETLLEYAKVFYQPDSSRDAIIGAGERAVIGLFNENTKLHTLNSIRLKKILRKWTQQPVLYKFILCLQPVMHACTTA